MNKEELVPKVKTVAWAVVMILVIIATIVIFRRSRDLEHRPTHRQPRPVVYNRKTLGETVEAKNIGIVTAYSGMNQEITGLLSDTTKRKYAETHGYTFYVDNHLFQEMESSRLSLIKPMAIKNHLRDHSWLLWTEVEVFIVNPANKLSDLIDDDYDAVLSKDWGGRQFNPAVLFFRNSDTAMEMIDMWEYYIDNDEHQNELRAFENLLKDRPDLAKQVKWVDQKLMCSYPHVELKNGEYKQDHGSGHHYYEDGDFIVNVVNCIRDFSRKDPICCAGIGAHYLNVFEKQLETYRSFLGGR